MVIKYRCENEHCSQYDEVQDVPPGKSAECQECGWIMTAVW